MSDRSTIEWTDATWNPVTGCTKVSPGCDNCYALTLAERFRGTPGHYFQPDGELYQPNHKPWSLEREPRDYPGAIRRWGKKRAGRDLDGRTHDEYPERVA